MTKMYPIKVDLLYKKMKHLTTLIFFEIEKKMPYLDFRALEL